MCCSTGAEKEGQTPTTLHLQDVSADTALRIAAEMAGLKAAHVGNVVWVTAPAVAAGLRTEDERAASGVQAASGGSALPLGSGGGALGFAGGSALGSLGMGGGIGGLMGGSPMGSRPPLQINVAPLLPRPTARVGSEGGTAIGKAPARRPIARKETTVQRLSKAPVKPVTLLKGSVTPVTFRAAIALLEKEFGLTPVLMDEAAFPNDEGNSPVKLQKMIGVRLETALDMILAQVGGAYLIRGDHVEITTRQKMLIETGRFPDEAGENGPRASSRWSMPCLRMGRLARHATICRQGLAIVSSSTRNWLQRKAKPRCEACSTMCRWTRPSFCWPTWPIAIAL